MERQDPQVRVALRVFMDQMDLLDLTEQLARQGYPVPQDRLGHWVRLVLPELPAQLVPRDRQALAEPLVSKAIKVQ